MSKWIAEFELEDGDTMPEHMDLEYKGAKLDFHCRPMWIPCSERLPKDGQMVLITTRRENILDVEIDTDTSIFYHASAFWKHYVIAWMPLPDPYKEESEGEG